MLDPVIHKHLDLMDDVERNIEDDISNIMNKIDIDMLINSPETELLIIVSFLKKRLLSEHIPKVLKAGIEFSRDLKKDGDIMIQKTKDGTVNEGKLFDDER